MKMQEILDVEEEEDRMQNFKDEDSVDDVLNFKEDVGRNEVSDDIENGNEIDIDQEISLLMGNDDVVNISELDKVFC